MRTRASSAAAWTSTVYVGTWPSKTGLAVAAAKAELPAIFDALASARMNAVFFQVRAKSDAVHGAAIEPWSRFLTDKQGSACSTAGAPRAEVPASRSSETASEGDGRAGIKSTIMNI